VTLNERVTASSSTTKVLKLRLEEDTVTIITMELMELARNTDDAGVDFLREGVRVLAQALMDVEVGNQIGAAHGERAPETRSAQRNGYRDRAWDTRARSTCGSPSCAPAATSPGFLEARTALGRSARCAGWWRSVMSRACRPAASTTSPPDGHRRDLQEPGVADLR